MLLLAGGLMAVLPTSAAVSLQDPDLACSAAQATATAIQAKFVSLHRKARHTILLSQCFRLLPRPPGPPPTWTHRPLLLPPAAAYIVERTLPDLRVMHCTLQLQDEQSGADTIRRQLLEGSTR